MPCATLAAVKERYGEATALIVVDVQNDFADPAGGLSVRGGDAVVPVINREIGAALADLGHANPTKTIKDAFLRAPARAAKARMTP